MQTLLKNQDVALARKPQATSLSLGGDTTTRRNARRSARMQIRSLLEFMGWDITGDTDRAQESWCWLRGCSGNHSLAMCLLALLHTRIACVVPNLWDRK